MVRKKPRRSSVASDRCFRLLRLKHEVQNDARVMKAVVEEVDVLRFCHSLGMAVSDEGNSFAMHQLELGLFRPSKYDADFKRFVREQLAVRGSKAAHVQGDEEDVRIGSLFGKRREVKAELERLGFWGRDCDEGLTTQEQGVYCLERTNSGQAHREFVVFAWLDAALFEPEAIRDTPAYILRFLISLSSNVTCCLSREDVDHIEREVHALSTTTRLQWNSCSVSFRVQKQEEQSDSVRCAETTSVSIPGGGGIKSVEFVGGVFPGVAVECATPSTTCRDTRSQMVRSVDLADWIVDKHEQHAVELPSEQVYPAAVRDELLRKFNLYPTRELHELRRQREEQQQQATQRIERETFQRAKETLDTAEQNVDLLFAVRDPSNSSRMDQALRWYEDFVQHLDRGDVLRELDEATRTTLRLPGRLQTNMDALNRAFTYRYPAFESTLDKIVKGAPLNARDGNPGGVVWGYFQGAWRKLSGSDAFGREFRAAMEHRRTRLQRLWVDTVEQVVSAMQSDMLGQRIVQSATDRNAQYGREEDAIKGEAMACVGRILRRDDNRQLHVKVSSLHFTKDHDAVHVKWSEEAEKQESKVVRMYQLCATSGAIDLSLLGTIELEPGVQVRKLAMVKTSQAVVVLVKDGRTTVRRIHFPLLSDTMDELNAEQEDVRTFPHVCSLCSIRASDRRVAFTYGTGEGRLGKVAFYRFNEAFSSLDTTRGFDLDATFRLAAPLQDILLTERSLCALDAQGEVQSYDLRTRRTSKKVSFGDGRSGELERRGVGGLLGLADELVLGRVRRGENEELCVESISSEDHRKLPLVSVGDGVSRELTVGCMNDVLYVIDAGKGVVLASELRVTVRSDAYRIQRSGAKSGRLGCPRGSRGTNDDSGEHWLRVFYHVFEKFPVRSLLDEALDPDDPFALGLTVVVSEAFEEQDTASMTGAGRDMHAVCKTYFRSIMTDLQRLNKPLAGLDLTALLTCRSSERRVEARTALGITSRRQVLTSIVSFVPVQICRAEDNMLQLLQDGEELVKTTDGASSSDESDAKSTDASAIARSIRFGLLSPLLETWNGRCVVVTSMGKQSTGKSYFLNHLAGTSFAISGSRCTDGAWMSLRFVSADVLLVVLDFEGLGSFERSEQEDIFLSVLNASVSMFTVFRMECRFDKDLDSLFARFQKGVQLIKKDPRLFRGLLYMSVKDVNMNDRQGVVDELASKLNAIFESSRDQNFLTEMYAGQVVINCTPPFGTKDFFQSMAQDAAQNLLSVVAPRGPAATGFATGKAFLDCLRLVLAKISILDWTSMDKSTKSLVVADVKDKLPGILRAGCHVSQSIVGEETIPSSLKEDVLHVGSREKIVVLLKDVCGATPALATKWMALDDVVPLDNIPDEQVDLGFDVTAGERRKTGAIQKTLLVLFQGFLALRGKTYGGSKLTAEDQAAFDAFLSFALRRRKMKLSCWLRGALPDSLADVRAQLEQQFADPLVVELARCQHRCAHCQLGCMRSVTHSPEVEHKCSTDHVCRGVCDYSACRDEEAAPCSRAAGHQGKCECAKGQHTCGQSCVLAGAANCDGTCAKRAGHAGAHRCSVQVHVCGARCSAETCKASCLLDIRREHSVHKCAELQCLHPCLMTGCSNVCGEKDHFHGQAGESRVFAEESGITRPLGSSQGVDEEVTHRCLASHACAELCRVDGICEQKVHLKKSARTYTGARCSFEYVLQEMNGCKKRCVRAVPSGLLTHEGTEHSCIATSSVEGEAPEMVHYCDVRCPSCSYYCNKHFGHLGLHATSHGNMRQTYFLAKSNDVDVEDRKYQVGEKGIAEMCNLFCAKMGRGHVHFLQCEGKDGEKCVYAGDGSKDHRRHCTDELFPPPEKAMDELLHAQFWTTIGWEDPCSDEERAVFTKCPFQCDASEHDEPDKARSFCLLDAWHQPELKPEIDDGVAYVDGHKFECVHAVDTGKFHSVFVLDSSGSMSGQPWQDLVCACNEFGINRLRDGGAGDLISFISFDNASRIHCEAQSLQEALKVRIPFTGGGTYFEEGLRAANEVLSRNKFEQFKAVLIFFSDGRPWNVDEAIRIARAVRVNYAKYDLRVFVVGFGRVKLSVLRLLAAEMGGEYRQVLDAEALRTEFQRIAAVLKKNEASLALLET